MWLQWLGLCTLTKSSTTSLSIAQCPEKSLNGLQKRTMGTSASDLAPVCIACVSKARPSQRKMLLSVGQVTTFEMQQWGQLIDQCVL